MHTLKHKFEDTNTPSEKYALNLWLWKNCWHNMTLFSVFPSCAFLYVLALCVYVCEYLHKQDVIHKIPPAKYCNHFSTVQLTSCEISEMASRTEPFLKLCCSPNNPSELQQGNKPLVFKSCWYMRLKHMLCMCILVTSQKAVWSGECPCTCGNVQAHWPLPAASWPPHHTASSWSWLWNTTNVNYLYCYIKKKSIFIL